MEVSRESPLSDTSPMGVGFTYSLSSYTRSVKNRKEYPKYKKANLEKHGVLETGDLAYLFVHQMHPAIALLRANKDLLGSDIDSQQKIDNEWYKVCKDGAQKSIFKSVSASLVRTSGNTPHPLEWSTAPLCLVPPRSRRKRLLRAATR